VLLFFPAFLTRGYLSLSFLSSDPKTLVIPFFFSSSATPLPPIFLPHIPLHETHYVSDHTTCDSFSPSYGYPLRGSAFPPYSRDIFPPDNPSQAPSNLNRPPALLAAFLLSPLYPLLFSTSHFSISHHTPPRAFSPSPSPGSFPPFTIVTLDPPFAVRLIAFPPISVYLIFLPTSFRNPLSSHFLTHPLPPFSPPHSTA